MGLWEVMLAMSRAQKQKRDTEAAATKTAWERENERQKLDLERQRVAVANRAFEQAKPINELQQQQAALTKQKAESYQRELEARLLRDRRNAEKLAQDMEFKKQLQPGAVQGQGIRNRVGEAQIGAANQRQALDEVRASFVPDETRARIDKLNRPASAPSSATGGRGTLGMPPADRQEHETNLRRLTFLQAKYERLVQRQREDPRTWASDPAWDADLRETKTAMDAVNASEKAILERSREREKLSQDQAVTSSVATVDPEAAKRADQLLLKFNGDATAAMDFVLAMERLSPEARKKIVDAIAAKTGE